MWACNPSHALLWQSINWSAICNNVPDGLASQILKNVASLRKGQWHYQWRLAEVCCLLVENYSNSRQVWSSRSFLQFLWGLRPNRLPSVAKGAIISKHRESFRYTKYLHLRGMYGLTNLPPTVNITAFTSRRTNLSPFTKGCRERDASMWLPEFLRVSHAPNNLQVSLSTQETYMYAAHT